MPDRVASVDRPSGVSAVAALFILAGSFLDFVGGLMLIFPGAVSMTVGSALLNGLELAGPFMFLLTGATGIAIGFGLIRLKNWARQLAISVTGLGAVMLIPTVSAAAVDFRPGLLWSGLGVVVRIAMVWYLFQTPTAEAFRRR